MKESIALSGLNLQLLFASFVNVQVRSAIQTRHIPLLMHVKLLLVQTLSPFFERFFIFSGPRGTSKKLQN